MQPFKVFLAFNKIVICIYVHLCLERETFQKQTRYWLISENCANHGDQRKQQNKAGKYVVMKRFYNNKNLEIHLQSIKQIPTIHLKLTDETMFQKKTVCTIHVNQIKLVTNATISTIETLCQTEEEKCYINSIHWKNTYTLKTCRCNAQHKCILFEKYVH